MFLLVFVLFFSVKKPGDQQTFLSMGAVKSSALNLQTMKFAIDILKMIRASPLISVVTGFVCAVLIRHFISTRRLFLGSNSGHSRLPIADRITGGGSGGGRADPTLEKKFTQP